MCSSKKRADRLVVEWQAECPALCRPDPVTNYLMADTLAVHDYARDQGISDEKQDLAGMRFQMQPPEADQPADRIFAWYSAVIYNRWDYDPSSGRYYRYAGCGRRRNRPWLADESHYFG